MREAEAVDGHVGGGVVAEHDHQREGVAESECDGRGQFAEHAGAFDLVGLGEHDAFVESGVAGADLLGGVEQNAHLDDGGGLDGLVGKQRCGLAGAQVVRVKRDMAVMQCSNRFDLLIKLSIFTRSRLGALRLGARGRARNGDGKDQANGMVSARGERHAHRVSQRVAA